MKGYFGDHYDLISRKKLMGHTQFRIQNTT
jgi:hypothetical protein